jgi:hypothetical protein
LSPTPATKIDTLTGVWVYDRGSRSWDHPALASTQKLTKVNRYFV